MSLSRKRKFGEIDQFDQVDRLNTYLENIIEGQDDYGVTPEDSNAAKLAQLNVLVANIEGIIATQTEKKRQREIELMEAHEQHMAEEEANTIIMENSQMLTAINSALTGSNTRLPRDVRIQLNNKIMSLIMDTVKAVEVEKELTADADWSKNIQGLFNGIIEYYTEMASYGYENAPEVLAKFGSLIAGSAIIGSTIYTPGTFRVENYGGLLVLLSSYLQTLTLTASGLFFLQRGGVPIQRILTDLGSTVDRCVKRKCEEITNIFNAGLDTLDGYLTKKLQDAVGSDSSVSSSFSTSTARTETTASQASASIKQILNVPPEQQLIELETSTTDAPVSVIDIPLSQRTISPISAFGSQPESPGFPEIQNPGGGRVRKSSRNIKVNKSRKGRKGKGRKGKGSMTKKGKKHYKTLKRNRRKMRR